jgi:hypothetical protein
MPGPNKEVIDAALDFTKARFRLRGFYPSLDDTELVSLAEVITQAASLGQPEVKAGPKAAAPVPPAAKPAPTPPPATEPEAKFRFLHEIAYDRFAGLSLSFKDMYDTMVTESLLPARLRDPEGSLRRALRNHPGIFHPMDGGRYFVGSLSSPEEEAPKKGKGKKAEPKAEDPHAAERTWLANPVGQPLDPEKFLHHLFGGREVTLTEIEKSMARRGWKILPEAQAKRDQLRRYLLRQPNVQYVRKEGTKTGYFYLKQPGKTEPAAKKPETKTAKKKPETKAAKKKQKPEKPELKSITVETMMDSVRQHFGLRSFSAQDLGETLQRSAFSLVGLLRAARERHLLVKVGTTSRLYDGKNIPVALWQVPTSTTEKPAETSHLN